MTAKNKHIKKSIIRIKGKFFGLFLKLLVALLFIQFNTLKAQVISNNGAGISITNGTVIQTDSVQNTAGSLVNDGTIDLTGTFINAGTTSGDGTFNLAGDWTNNGVFVPGTSIVNFNGTQIQTITSPGGEHFYHLVINNSGIAANNRIVLSNDVEITDTFTFTSGNVETGINTLYLSHQSEFSLQYTSLSGSRVIGKFERGINAAANYLFPVGSASNYNPLNLTLNNAPTAGSVLSEFIVADPGDSGLPLEDDSVEIYQAFDDGYWSLTANAFSSNDFNISLDGAGFTPPFQDISRIIKRPSGGDWLLDGTHSDAIGTVAFRNNLTGDISPLGTHFTLGRCRPRIWVQPQDTAVCDDESAAFSVVATGRQPLTYQWQLNMGVGWNDISDGGIYSGANMDTLRLSTTTTIMNGYRYRVIITDKYGNSTTSVLSATLIVNPRPIVTATPDTDTICSGDETYIEISSTVPGTAYTLEVLYGAAYGATTTLAGDTIKQVLINPTLDVDSVVYRIVPTGPLPTSCDGTVDTVVIWVEPTVTITASNDTICDLATTNIAITSPNTVSNPLGVYYTWTVTDLNSPGDITGYSNNNTGASIAASIAQTLDNHTNIARRVTYQITPWTLDNSDNLKCSGTPVNIDIWIEPTVTISASNDTICDLGTTNIVITSPNTVTNALGIYYTWTVIDPNSPGDITGYSNNGAGESIATAIGQMLNNESDTARRITYRITPWTLDNENYLKCGGTPIDIDIWIEPTPRVVPVIVRDTICNDTYTQITLTTPTVLTAGAVTFDYTSTSDIQLNGNSTGINDRNDGYIIADSLHNISPAYTPKQATYTIIPRAITTGCANGPSIDATITVHPTANTYFSSSNSNDSVSCYSYSDAYGQIVAENGVGIFTYQWDDPMNQTTATATGLSLGTYPITVTDNQGCTKLDTFRVHQPDPLYTPVDSISNVSCFGLANGFIRVAPIGANGGYNYIWSNGSSADSISGLSGDLYYVTVIDRKGCIEDTVILVQEPGPPSAGISKKNATCFGDNDGWARIDAVGATGFLWSTGEITPQINNLSEGWYAVTALSAEACQIEKSVYISQPDPLTSSTVSTNISCAGDSDGTIDLTHTGGNVGYQFTYAWSTPDGSGLIADAEDQTGLTGGTYYATVTDTLGCQVLDTAIVNEPPLFSSTISFSNVSCFGANDGSIEILASGGNNDYSYEWSNGETLSLINNIGSGNYMVTVSDAKNCEIYNSATITEPDLLETFISATDVTCFGYDDATAKLDILGGNGGYIIDWSNGANTDSIYGLSDGIYNVTVTDINNCVTTNNVEISEPEQIESNLYFEHLTCFEDNDGLMVVSPTGGRLPFSYSWSHNSLLADSMAINLGAGSYTVSVVDNNSCLEVASAVITQPDPIIADILKTDISCFGMNDGYISLSMTGGTPDYTYSWTNGNNEIYEMYETSADMLSEGVYNINITDINNCYIDTAIGIIEPEKLVIDPVMRKPSCPDMRDGFIELNIEGGTEPYYVYWDNGSSDENLYEARSGIFDLLINDNNLCEIDTSFILRSDLEFCFDIPTAFSPNDDNNNETWAIYMQGLYPYAEVEIFDRYGKRVFYSKGYEESQFWDGTYNGRELPMDTYLYIINLKNGFGRISGTVTLVR